MTPELHQRIRKIFDDALDRPPAERLAFVKSACPDHPEIQDAVLSLLDAHQESESFLEDETPSKLRVGRYVVTREIGRGPNGAVYEAADPLIGRTVAVKMIP